MKPCHENNGAVICLGRTATARTILRLNLHTTFEYLNRNVSFGQLLKHTSKSVVVCARKKTKKLTKTYNKGDFQVL